MKIEQIIWIDDVVDKIIKKHNIQQSEVREVFSNKPYFRFIEKGHRIGENVYAALGITDEGRYVIIFFIYKRNKNALILTARDMTKAERRKYERK